MKEKLITLKANYKDNPGWHWLMATIFLFPILPEYISPFILFIGFIIFKVQWTKEGRKAKVGTLGKIEIAFMTLALVSVIWSKTKLDTLGMAGLWWGMFLVQVMIFNLANTKQKINKLLKLIVASASINGLVGAIQICSYALYDAGYISQRFVLQTPFYKGFDEMIYTWLPFEIITNTFDDRASGFFSNPNLLASYMIIAYPISIFLFLNAKTKKQKNIYFWANLLISAGMSSTLTRAGCVLALFGWLFMFCVLIKRHYKDLLQIFIPTVAIIFPSLLARYGILELPQLPNKTFGNGTGGILPTPPPVVPNTAGEDAQRSTQVHFEIWRNVVDYLTTNWKAFITGLGFGCESTGIMLLTQYELDKPHAHNFIFEIWAELGIIGIIILSVIIIKAFTMLLVVNSNNGKRFDLVFCIFTSLMLLLLFGLTDYIFNSPKQIILFMILLGITQAINYCYETAEIKTPTDLIKAASRGVQGIVKIEK